MTLTAPEFLQAALKRPVAVLVLFGYWLGSRSDSDDTTTTPEPSAAASPDGVSGDGDDGTEPVTQTSVATTAGQTVPLVIEPTAENPEGATRYAVLQGGQVYLRGFVPSEEMGQAIVEAAAAVIGPENVINEYQTDPRAAQDESMPVYINDAVLFARNSAEIDPAFIPVLELAVVFLTQNPQAGLTVVARTDAVGTVEDNLALSQERAAAVIEYLVARGADAAQLTPDARGEEGATQTTEADAAAHDRRAEFIVRGLLD
jgi:outer membrane protein OmpA-like peptidoglycan-associated protein